ncbi:MAG: MBL fold metallo-hydrolase [Alphaproteobacteria bacterium]|nr:MBL fold metallo-hydrolase [Alphaproteobacteria bacterium]
MTVACHDALTVVTLGSGSKGNATFVTDGTRGVLVDCGLSTAQILARLDAVGLGDVPIDAVLITHEHGDHVNACAVLDRALRKRQGTEVPFLVTAGTLARMNPKVTPTRTVTVAAGDHVPWHGWTLESFAVPHDTAAPIGWAIEAHGVRAAVITDLGHAPRNVAHQLSTLDVAVLEFNHDEAMLADGPYPPELKRRIRGRHGHLSNAQAAQLLTTCDLSRLRHLVLAHLSEENNTPEHALVAAEAALLRAGVCQVTITLAEQRQAIPPVTVRARPRAVARAPEPVQPSLF